MNKGQGDKGIMDVRDQSSKIDQARDQYREAQEDLKNSYDKNLKSMKETYDFKVDKQAKNYDQHKTKLEEDNRVNNELYSDKTRSAISKSQQEFKNKIKENTTKFEEERNSSKNQLNEKLSGLSESYKKSFEENNRYEEQVKKSMGERYSNANKRYQEDFNKQITDMDNKSKAENLANRENSRMEKHNLQHKNSEEMESLRSTSNEQKFKEVNRLRDDNENLRTTLGRDNQMLKDRQEERVADLLKLKGKESDDGMKNFENLQQSIRQKNINDQEKQNVSHNKEAKELEKKFNDDVKNIQSIANQKIKGGTNADNLSDELKTSKNSYENRLQLAREELAKNNKYNTEKEETIDLMYRDKLKESKTSGIENLAKQEAESAETLKKTVYENREKNNSMIDRYKMENNNVKKNSDEKLTHADEQSKNKIKQQRIEFGRVVNTMNDKNMETINSLKEDYSKDKSTSIEKSKKDFNEEKIAMKNEFNRQSQLKDSLYEQKLAEIEKQTGKIIENYENRISQIARKAENEVNTVKTKDEARSLKETQANALAFDTIKAENRNEIAQMRDKYEGVISRNQQLNQQKTNSIIQKYEDQLARERTESQKELAVRVGESQSQFERLYKSSELEKASLRSQYEQRIETLRLNSLAQENSKKA